MSGANDRPDVLRLAFALADMMRSTAQGVGGPEFLHKKAREFAEALVAILESAPRPSTRAAHRPDNMHDWALLLRAVNDVNTEGLLTLAKNEKELLLYRILMAINAAVDPWIPKERR